MNNLRQLSLANLGYATRKGHFPGYENSVGNVARATWIVAILPEIGQLELAQDWQDTSVPVRAKPAPPIRLLVCPSDPIDTENDPWNSYVANSGWARGGSGGSDMQLAASKLANGVFHDLSVQTPPEHIAVCDGTSATILLSENTQATRWDDRSRRAATVFVWHESDTPPRRRINIAMNDTPLSLNTARPSSFHPGGVNIAFCDGHAMFLSQDVDYRVYAQLMTPDDRRSDLPAEWTSQPLRSADFE